MKTLETMFHGFEYLGDAVWLNAADNVVIAPDYLGSLIRWNAGDHLSNRDGEVGWEGQAVRRGRGFCVVFDNEDHGVNYNSAQNHSWERGDAAELGNIYWSDERKLRGTLSFGDGSPNMQIVPSNRYL